MDFGRAYGGQMKNQMAHGQGNTRWHRRVSNPGPFDPESYALLLRHTGWA